jgi:hypothetical protein
MFSVRRLLPLGPLDQGDHPVDERLARLGGDLDHDPVRQHRGAAGHRGPVAAGLADDRCGLAGDGRLVHRRDALDHVPVAGDDLAGLDHHEVAEGERGAGHGLLAERSGIISRMPAHQLPCHRVALGPAQRVGLGLAAALGHRFGQVGEHHGQPQPDHDGPVERRRRADRGVHAEQGADLDHEHDRVLDLDPRVQLLERVRGRLPQDLRIEQAATDPPRLGGRLRAGGRRGSTRALSCHRHQCSPSANTPSASAGK